MGTTLDWPGEGQIIAFARDAAQHVQHGEPADDLHRLLALALDREAVVSSAYLGSAVRDRLDVLEQRHQQQAPIVTIIKQAITFVWLQEEAHTNLLRNIEDELLDAPYAAQWHEIYGRTKGALTQLAAGNQAVVNVIAQGVIALGAALGISPAFSDAVANLSNRAFFAFSRELEAAAILGYEQIQQRVILMQKESGAIPLNIGLLTILGEILVDELRHHDLFATIRTWFGNDDRLRPELSHRECQARILSIFQDTPKTKARTDEPRYEADRRPLLLDEHAAEFLGAIGVRNLQPTSRESRRSAALAFFLQQ